MITHISPLGSMDMLSQLEVDMLKRTASSDLYQLFRNCSLAVLNSGSLTDNSKELLSRFESFDINVLRRERGEARSDQPAGRRFCRRTYYSLTSGQPVCRAARHSVC